MNQKLLLLTGILIFVTLITACSVPGSGEHIAVAAPASTIAWTETPLPPTPTSTPPAECSPETLPDFADFASWTKVNNKPIQGHETWVDIYVNDFAEEIYLSASGDLFPACAKIVKTHLESPESETISAITVMVKIPAGYDPDHQDWWWGMYDKTGQVAEMSGKVQVCIACHQPVSAADYVFSQAVMAESHK